MERIECLCAPIEPRQSRFAKGLIKEKEVSIRQVWPWIRQPADARVPLPSAHTAPRPADGPSNARRGIESAGMAEDPLADSLASQKCQASAGEPPWRISEGGLTRVELRLK